MLSGASASARSILSGCVCHHDCEQQAPTTTAVSRFKCDWDSVASCTFGMHRLSVS